MNKEISDFLEKIVYYMNFFSIPLIGEHYYYSELNNKKNN